MWRKASGLFCLTVVACSSGAGRPVDPVSPAEPPDAATGPRDQPDSVAPPAPALTADAAPGVPDSAPISPIGGPPPPLGPFPLAAVQAAKPALFAATSARIEGPSWRKGEVIFAADGGGLMRADAQGKIYRYFPTLDPVGSFTLADDSVLLCEKKYILLQLFPDDTIGVIVGEGGAAGFCNDITVDADGNIYFSESHKGAIMKVTPAGELTTFVAGRRYPNGLEIDRANEVLYFSDTAVNQLFRVPLRGGAVESLGAMIADGMAIDAWGNLWLAQVTAGQGIVFDPQKRAVLARVPLGGPQATNLVFGGPDHDTLFSTVAGKGITRIPVAVRGFSHPGAPRYALKSMLDLKPTNTPLN
jgi:sugar lactone lactonase YvrE